MTVFRRDKVEYGRKWPTWLEGWRVRYDGSPWDR